MLWILLALLLLGLVLLPGFWVRRVLEKYSEPADRYRERGSGGELARHLLDRFGLQSVGVESTDQGDHYDPEDRKVRLTADKFNGHSLTAVTVAAHEVGHAIQHARQDSLFLSRQRLARLAITAQRAGGGLMLLAPVILLMTRLPGASLGMLLVAVGSMLIGTLVHLVTLPVELDASYNKALPILESGDYLLDGDLPHARRILKAAALTYVAASLASLLNVGRWIAVLRR